MEPAINLKIVGEASADVLASLLNVRREFLDLYLIVLSVSLKHTKTKEISLWKTKGVGSEPNLTSNSRIIM
jgi:hypothetical protein